MLFRSDLLGVSRETVSRWWTAYASGGPGAIPGDRTGRPVGTGRTLSDEQAGRIQRLIDDQSPRELGIAAAVWTRKAVRECRDQGVSDPMQLLLAGARGYLDVCIEQRELAGMFARGDGPPGFELMWRQRLSDWVSRNTEFFARSGEPLDEAAAIVMTGAMMLAVAEISRTSDAARAGQLADGVLEVLSRLQARPS